MGVDRAGARDTWFSRLVGRVRRATGCVLLVVVQGLAGGPSPARADDHLPSPLPLPAEASPRPTPRPGAGAPLRIPPTERFQLGNGVRVVLAPEPWAQQVAIAVAYAVGSGDDPAGYRGLAHLAEHVSYRATRHLRDQQGLGLLAGIGAVFNGVTWPEATEFEIVAPAKQLETLLWFESERMAFAVDGVTEELVQAEKRVVLSELSQKAHGGSVAFWSVMRGLYGRGHPFTQPEDPEDELQAIGADGVRRFMQTAYRPDHATVAIVGRFDSAQARALIERYFGSIRSAPVPPSGGVMAPPPRFCGVHRVQFDHAFWLGRPTVMAWSLPPPRSSESALGLDALVSTLEVRLQNARAEQQIRVSGVGAGLQVFRSHALLMVEGDPLSEDDGPKLERVIEGEIQRLAEVPISDEDVRVIRAGMLIGLARMLHDPLARARALALGDEWRDPSALWAAAHRLAPDDLRRAAQRLSHGHGVVQLRPAVWSPRGAVVVSDQGGCQ